MAGGVIAALVIVSAVAVATFLCFLYIRSEQCDLCPLCGMYSIGTRTCLNITYSIAGTWTCSSLFAHGKGLEHMKL